MFISYARDDERHASAIRAALEDRGVSTWQDTADIPAGASWLREIERATRQVQVALILLGREQLSPWQQRELDVLLMLEGNDRVRIIPALVPGASIGPTDMPPFLQRFQAVDFRAGLASSGLDALAADILLQKRPAVGQSKPPVWRKWMRAAAILTLPLAVLLWILGRSLTPPSLVKVDLSRVTGQPDAQTDQREVADGPAVLDGPTGGEPKAKESVDARPRSKRVRSPPPPPFLALNYFSYQGDSPALKQLSRQLPLAMAQALRSGTCPVRLSNETGDQIAPARRAGARYVVRGSLHEVSSQVRMNAQLVDARTESILGGSDAIAYSPHFMASEQELTREMAAEVASKTSCAADP